MTFNLAQSHIAVIGLGYVGLPLALALSRHVRVTGYDVDTARVDELRAGTDRNREVSADLLSTTNCVFTADLPGVAGCNVYIVTVPTPVDERNKPDLRLVERASQAVAQVLKRGDIVVYESTVYPGVTEDICGPILEDGSGLKAGRDFFLGYSPERINPGDSEHTVSRITKVVAGQTREVADFLAALYGQVNGGNVFKARDIRTAEASKVIENAQRDINIAFVNEVAMVLGRLGLSACDVLEAAGTKWNFLKFTPGLVGGHCIGVDPYYLAECAIAAGHDPKVILAGRDINESMGAFVAGRIDALVQKPSRILVLGITFKENINDVRNTKAVDVVRALRAAGHAVDVHDPHARPGDMRHEYGLDVMNDIPAAGGYDALALLVGHDAYRGMTAESLRGLVRAGGLIFDMKGFWRDDSTSIGETQVYKTL